MLENLFVNNKAPAYSDETIDILRLIRSENVGPKTFFNLIKFFGSASRALENVEDFSVKGGRAKPIKVYSKDSVAFKWSVKDTLYINTKNQKQTRRY